MKNNLRFFCIFILILALSVQTSFADRIGIVLDEDKVTDESIYETDPDLFDLDYDPSGDNVKVWDPWERFNRSIFEFNKFILINIGRPFYYGVYSNITTPPMRRSVTNIVETYSLPIHFINYTLQLDFKNSMKALASFCMNFTIGVFGFANPARAQGIFPDKTNLGVTMAKYRVPTGPYIVLPFFGPNDVRGSLSWGAELLVNPFTSSLIRYGSFDKTVPLEIAITVDSLYVIDNVAFTILNFYDLMEASFDPYVLMRDAYGRSQDYKIKKVRGKI